MFWPVIPRVEGKMTETWFASTCVNRSIRQPACLVFAAAVGLEALELPCSPGSKQRGVGQRLKGKPRRPLHLLGRRQAGDTAGARGQPGSPVIARHQRAF